MKLFATLFSLMISALPLTAMADECNTLLNEANVTISRCVSGRSDLRVNILLGKAQGDELEVVASYDPQNPGTFFRRLQANSARKILSREDQFLLRKALAKTTRAALGNEAFRAADFLAWFAAPGFEVRDYDLSAYVVPTSPIRTVNFATLCGDIGHRHKGIYTIGRAKIVQIGVVGRPECLGKCGDGCGDSRSVRDGRYTQECFNHDLCRRRTGENMGECEDEFWAAADGFMNAPTCE